MEIENLHIVTMQCHNCYCVVDCEGKLFIDIMKIFGKSNYIENFATEIKVDLIQEPYEGIREISASPKLKRKKIFGLF